MNFCKFISAIAACAIVILCAGCTTSVDTKDPDTTVQVIGAMRNVMWKGELHGTIALDTIQNKEHLYGLGPVEYLAGELLIIDGKSYKSTVVADTEMRVEETFDAKAPFFVYANVPNWKEQHLPDSVRTISHLIIKDRKQMGHLADLHLRPGIVKLYLPVE